MTINDESTLMTALADRLKAYPRYYTAKNVDLASYNMLNTGVEHGVIIFENTISNPASSPHAYMGMGQATTYTFSLRVVYKISRKDETGAGLRDYVRLVRTIIDEKPTLASTVQSCRATSAGAPNYLLKDGGGAPYRYRDITVEIELVEEATLIVEEDMPDPLAVP